MPKKNEVVLKCPNCQKDLELDKLAGPIYSKIAGYYFCENNDCEVTSIHITVKEED